MKWSNFLTSYFSLKYLHWEIYLCLLPTDPNSPTDAYKQRVTVCGSQHVCYTKRDFWASSLQTMWFPSVLSWIPYSGSRQIPWPEELRPPVNQNQPRDRSSSPTQAFRWLQLLFLKVNIPNLYLNSHSPRSSFWALVCQHLDCNLLRDSELAPPS